jgi:Fur family transcriptional regulator, ferric uptake regulator
VSCEAELVDELRAQGHKLTPQRMLVVRALKHASGHIKASEILDEVRQDYPYVDVSTVYRTLNVLKDMRVVTETHMGGGEAIFEWVPVERHHHLICRKCDGVTQIDHQYLDTLATDIQKASGFRADIDHFAIFGLCVACQRELTAD